MKDDKRITREQFDDALDNLKDVNWLTERAENNAQAEEVAKIEREAKAVIEGYLEQQYQDGVVSGKSGYKLADKLLAKREVI